MKLESINLLEVETNEGFLDILDLEKVAKIVYVNDFMGVGGIKMKNGLMKYLTPDSVRRVAKCLNVKR